MTDVEAAAGDEVQKLKDHVEHLTKKFKLVSERHRGQTDQFHLLERIIHVMAEPHDFDAIAEGFMDIAMDSVDAESGALYFYDGEENELYFAAARGPKASDVLSLDITIPPGKGLVGACFEQLHTIAVSDVSRDARFSKEVSDSVGYEVRSILTAPITSHGRALGAIQVLNKKSEDSFTGEEVEWFKRLGRYAGDSFGLFLQFTALRAELAAGRDEDDEDLEESSVIVDESQQLAWGADPADDGE